MLGDAFRGSKVNDVFREKWREHDWTMSNVYSVLRGSKHVPN